jgi:hypothetical protein
MICAPCAEIERLQCSAASPQTNGHQKHEKPQKQLLEPLRSQRPQRLSNNSVFVIFVFFVANEIFARWQDFDRLQYRD